jgi:RNA polymerase sigma-70 factor (ECF subfamily)
VAEASVPDPLQSLIETDYQQYVVQRALQLMQNEFQPATWQAFLECTAHGRPPAEVAAELRPSVASVYAAKSRVLRRLRAEMKGLLD